ncbi:MAG: c-type cytochrome, partial [Candidatus Promineifilaceae bacterium]
MKIPTKPVPQIQISMITNRLRVTAGASLLLILLISSGFALAQSLNTPEAKPDAAAGREVFNDNCVSCHGTLAMGDGRAVAELNGHIPTALASQEYLRDAVPSEMFQVITDGRIQNLMPPFGVGSANAEPLPVSQRWDAIAYVYSLGTPADSIDDGRAVYETTCLECHGESGQGDGERAGDLESPPADLGDLA